MAVVTGGPLHMRPCWQRDTLHMRPWRQEAHLTWGRCENGPLHTTVTTRDPLHMRPCWKQTHFMRPWWLGNHYTCPWWQGTQFTKMFVEILSVYLSSSSSAINITVGRTISKYLPPESSSSGLHFIRTSAVETA